jgi:LPS export ABC transporter permease LptF/LPS export ABC transporter permease LptG
VRLLDRYLIREISGPLALGFLVYTFILLLDALFDAAEMIIRRGLPVATVGELLLLSLPNIVVLTIPMALLFGVLIAIGRLSSDSELVALRASGVSLLSLYRPILVLSAVLTLANVLLMVFVLPWGNHRLQLRRIEALTQNVSGQVQPRVFWDEWENQVLYVFEAPPRGEPWRGVFLAESVPSTQENRVTVAERGQVRVDDDGERVVLELGEARVHEVDLSRPDSYQVSQHERLEAVLEDRFASSQREQVSVSKGVRELTIPELLDWRSDPARSLETRRLAQVEIHKKFAIPFACLVFGIFALPLGFNNRRGSKASGFALSILVIVAYWVLLDTGEKWAQAGGIPPWLAMWGPNLLLAMLGLFLLARRNRDKSLLLTRVDRWIRRDLGARIRFLARRRQERAAERKARRHARPGGTARAGRHQVVIRLRRFQVPFPNILDRYVFRVFAGIFGLTVLSGVAIYVVADLTGKADEIFKNQVPTSVVMAYYKYSSLQIFYEICPVLVLVSTLITFSVFSKSNEITALKALGVSLYRIAVPALLFAAGISLFTVFLESKVLPAANQRVAQLNDRIRGRESSRTYRRADRQWLFGQDRYIYNYIHYDPQQQALQRLQVFEFDPQHRLTRRLVADRAVYVGDGRWRFENGWFRTFDGRQVTSYERFPGEVLTRFPEDPAYFESDIRPPDQMGYTELRHYVEDVEASGQAVPELRVELQNKIAYPLISLVMALVALPFAFRLGRQGALYGVGLSIVLGMIFLAIFAFFTTLGEAGVLPPAAAVWSPNVVFTLASVYLFLGVRT